jgi:hypothetical protein
MQPLFELIIFGLILLLQSEILLKQTLLLPMLIQVLAHPLNSI